MIASQSFLLDTNILVSLLRGNSLGKAIDKQFNLVSTLNRCVISVVTVGEMHSLARQLGWGDHKKQILERMLDEIVWIDINHSRIFSAYADLDDFSRKSGRKLGKNDLWIAATSKSSGLVLLTTDNDFDHLETMIERIWINPSMT